MVRQVSPLAKDLITKMLDPTAERRITTERALQHAWITGDALTLSPQAGEELSTEEPGKEGVSSVRSALSRFNARRAMEKVKSGARRLSRQLWARSLWARQLWPRSLWARVL